MNLQKEIIPELYTSVKGHYDSGLYSNAILDAMKVLTDLIRLKTKLDGDGVNLVGQAFGGSAPLIKISPMQKVSEIDEQRGLEQLLRGLYTGIRNTRTHEKYEDKKEECDAVLIFINYIYKRIIDSKTFFVLEEFKKRIFDPLFPEKSEYAEILVSEIPYDELVNTTISILDDREKGDPKKLAYFFDAIFNKADCDQKQSIIKAFSNELKKAQTDSEIIGLIRYIKPELWTLIDNDTKLRIENRIVSSVSEGSLHYGELTKGALGTWGSLLGQYFKLKRDLAIALIGLLSQNWYTQNYVAEYYLYHLESIIEGDYLIEKCCKELAYATLGNNAKLLKSKFAKDFTFFPKKWRHLFLEKGLRYKHNDEQYYNELQKMKDAEDMPF